jgi:hypothetical protein
MQRSLNIWERQQQIRFRFRSKSRGDRIQVMLSAIQSRTFCQVKQHVMGRACNMNGEKWNAYGILVRKSEKERPRRRWRIILMCILKMYNGAVWTELIRFRRATSGGLF